MSGPDEPALPPRSGRVLVLGSFVLAVAAAATLALGAQDASLLRLGVVAALWAALLGAFAAVRTRRELSVGAERAEELRTLYRLELDREIAARREHELTVERELREQAERREREDLAALRAELHTLREALSHLIGGDMLVERVALRAESTRWLPLADPARNAGVGPGRIPAAEPAAGPPRRLPPAEARVTSGDDRDPWNAGQRPDPSVRSPARAATPDRPAAQSPRPGPFRSPLDEPAIGAAGSRPAADRDDAQGLDIFARTAADLAGKTGSDPSWQPAVSATSRWEPAVSSSRQAGSPYASSRSEPEPAAAGPGGGRHSRTSTPSRPSASPGSGVPGSGTYHTGSYRGGSVASGSYGSYAAGARGGTAPGNGASGNRHSGGPQRAADGEPAASASAHGSGRSVKDLLAAYGQTAAPRRRRRRADE